MNLGELALVCYAYGAMTYDDALAQFTRRVEGEPDLLRKDHRLALLHWLNQLQCRQFPPGYHDLASAGLLEWYQESDEYLPPKDKHLWQMSETNVDSYAPLFDVLSKKVACYRNLGPNRRTAVTFGPTAAARILFVLRPKVFVAWDEPIRAGLHFDGSGRSYLDFLIRLRDELLELREQCRGFGISLLDVPAAIGRPLSTPAQLIDEYYSATVTHGVAPPSRLQVARWLEWYAAATENPTLVERGGALTEACAEAALVRPPGS